MNHYIYMCSWETNELLKVSHGIIMHLFAMIRLQIFHLKMGKIAGISFADEWFSCGPEFADYEIH